MAIQTRIGTLTTLQNAQAGAANGTALDVTDATEVWFEISGTFTNITANFEAAIDGGTVFSPVAVMTPAGTRASTATAAGLYSLADGASITTVRVRTTVATPTGSMTVRARAATR